MIKSVLFTSVWKSASPINYNTLIFICLYKHLHKHTDINIYYHSPFHTHSLNHLFLFHFEKNWWWFNFTNLLSVTRVPVNFLHRRSALSSLSGSSLRNLKKTWVKLVSNDGYQEKRKFVSQKTNIPETWCLFI